MDYYKQLHSVAAVLHILGKTNDRTRAAKARWRKAATEGGDAESGGEALQWEAWT